MKHFRILSLLLAVTLAFAVQGLTAQETTVRGTVKDDTGESLIGVTIQGPGGIGTVTDVDGRFSIQVPRGTKLTVSYIGYITQTVEAAPQMTIELKPDVQQLEEVVVVGYGTLEKKQVTSSITSVKAEDLTLGAGGATIMEGLAGKIGSLVISRTPSPNTDTSLQLRGMASVNTSRAPLVVIDGMPGGDIRSVVQEDIASIDILKDAAAGAIYGTRATGGVILITTKQAKEGKLRLSYTGEAIFKQDFGKPRVMNREEYLTYKSGATDYGHDTDWWEEGISPSLSNRHVLTLQGGSEDAKIYATFMYEDNRGVIHYDDRKDLGGRINTKFNLLNGWVGINAHLEYRQAKRNYSSMLTNGYYMKLNPTLSPDDPSNWENRNGLSDINATGDAALLTDEGLDKWFRPDVELKLNIKPVEGLSFHQTLGYENRQWEYHGYEPSGMSVTQYHNPTGSGRATLKFSKNDYLNSDGYFAYIHAFGEHSFNANLGYSYYQADGENFSMQNSGFAVDGTALWNIGSGTYLNNPEAVDNKASMSSGKDITQRLFALFGRLHYSYKDTYIGSVTVRREGSSKFAANKRWGLFWQTSGAWRIVNEPFMKGAEWVNDLKLRLAYGVTGNEGFSANYAAMMYGSASYAMMPDGTWARTYGIANNINPDLGWEEKHEFNLGIDYELFGRKLYGKLDIYRRNVEGLIYNVSVSTPPYTISSMYKNIGTLKNSGWELEIGSELYKNRDWTYNTRLNISHNSTKVGSMWGESQYVEGGFVGRAGNVHRLEENTTVGSYFLYRYAGLDEEGRFLAYDRNGNIICPETDGKNDEDKVYMGNYIPKVVIGWTHDLKWKSWSLSATFASWIDFDIYNSYEHVHGTVGGEPGAFRNQLLMAYTKNAAMQGETLECSYFMQDGTFFKVENVTLSYLWNLKKHLKLVDTARIYLTGNNLVRFTGYKGLNPEVDITGWEGGIEQAAYPQTRTFTLGVQLNF
jgi:TonB-linked SusC/RagA family outer membrane protein